jgi:hypothetical protein
MTSGNRTPAQEEAERRKAQRIQKELTTFGTTQRLPPETRDNREIWWSSHFEWLKGRGYLLRARYAPGWAPSWNTSGRVWFEHEDSLNLEVYSVFDGLPPFLTPPLPR